MELFFDLVFVFTITQVASVLDDTPTGIGLARTAVFLSLIWWMYGGYAWLTNALDLNRTRPRLLLLTGTAGFLVMSLTVPKATGPGPWALLFGVAYLLVVTLHLVGFIGTSGRRGIIRIGPLNMVSALVVVAAGLAPPPARLWLWASAAVIEVLTPLVSAHIFAPNSPVNTGQTGLDPIFQGATCYELSTHPALTYPNPTRYRNVRTRRWLALREGSTHGARDL